MNYLQHWATLLNSNQHDRLISDFESSVRGVRFLAKEHRDALVSLLTSVVQEAQGLSTNTCPKTNDREHSPTALIRLKMEIDSANSKIAQLKHRNEERRLTAIKYFRKMKEAEAKLQVDGNHQSCDSYDRTISELKYKLEACKKTQEETYSEANTYHHKWKCSERKVFTLEKQLKELNMTLQHFTFPTSNGALYDPIEEYSPTREDEQEDSIESPNDGSQYDYQPENQSMDTDYRYTSSQGSIQNMRNITISSSLLSKPTFGKPKRTPKFVPPHFTQARHAPDTHNKQPNKPKRTTHHVTLNQLVDSDFLKEGDEVVAFVTDHPREGIICREHGTFGIKDNISGTFYTHPSTWVSDEDVLVHCNKDLPKKSTAHGKKTAGYSGWDNVRVKRFDRSTGKTTNVTLTFVRDAYERRFGIKT